MNVRLNIASLAHQFAQLVRGATSSVSGAYERIGADQVAEQAALVNAWKSPGMASGQKTVVDAELRRMRTGDVIGVYRAFADAVLWTGVDRGTLLEIGCGGGHYAEVLQHLVAKPLQYIGLDYSEALLAVARSRSAETCLVSASATSLPFASKSIDIVVSGCVLLHIADYRTAIRESARVAREWLIFHRTPIVDGPTVFFTKLAYGVKCLEIAFGLDDLIDLFGESGLAVAKTFELATYRVPRTEYKGRSVTFICKPSRSY